MSKPGHSKLPCHGCGSTLTHRTGQVCDDCRAALREHREIMAQRAATKGAVVMLSKERAYALPRLPHLPGRGFGDEPPIQTGFLALVAALSTKAAYDSGAPQIFRKPPKDTSLEEWRTNVLINPDHAKVLGDTYEAIRVSLEHAYAKGHAEGRNLLGQLASGQITADQFNDTAIRKEGGTP